MVRTSSYPMGKGRYTLVNWTGGIAVQNKFKVRYNTMAFNFKQCAQEQTLLSPIMTGKKKLNTEDILDQELTIIAFDFAPKVDQNGQRVVDDATGALEEFGVVVFKEMPDKYYCVGTIFTQVCKAWAAEFNNPAEASKVLEAQGGVGVKFTSTKTKQGRPMTAVEILD